MKAQQSVLEKVIEAITARGFSPAEAQQMVARLQAGDGTSVKVISGDDLEKENSRGFTAGMKAEQMRNVPWDQRMNDAYERQQAAASDIYRRQQDMDNYMFGLAGKRFL